MIFKKYIFGLILSLFAVIPMAQASVSSAINMESSTPAEMRFVRGATITHEDFPAFTEFLNTKGIVQARPSEAYRKAFGFCISRIGKWGGLSEMLPGYEINDFGYAPFAGGILPGCTLLMNAIYSSNESMVVLLVEQGARMDVLMPVPIVSGSAVLMTPLDWARHNLELNRKCEPKDDLHGEQNLEDIAMTIAYLNKIIFFLESKESAVA
jgi:hypothetical protein